MRIVVALGGNAILRRDDRGTVLEQRAAIRDASGALSGALTAADTLILTHGNGPQVGRLLLQDEALPDVVPRYPLDIHVAETQGQLGSMIAVELAAAFVRTGHPRPVSALVTHVVVDAADPAFLHPTKPIGPFLSAKGAAEYRARGLPTAAAPDGGWRRVVASPEPLEIVEAQTLLDLLAAGHVPIAAGGGGVPVVREGGGLRGVSAVIDKDLTAALLAITVGADLLVIATDVEQVVLGYGTDDARPIDALTADDAEQGVEDGTFPRGSMGEKVLACARAARAGVTAAIGSLAQLDEVIAGRSGTRVTV